MIRNESYIFLIDPDIHRTKNGKLMNQCAMDIDAINPSSFGDRSINGKLLDTFLKKSEVIILYTVFIVNSGSGDPLSFCEIDL